MARYRITTEDGKVHEIEIDEGEPGFLSGLARGSMTLQAILHPIHTLASLTGAQELKNAAQHLRQGKTRDAALSMLLWQAGPLIAASTNTVTNAKEAMDAFRKGDYMSTMKHVIAASNPPFLASALEGAELIGRGNTAEGAGMIAGNLLDLGAIRGGPKAVSIAKSVPSTLARTAEVTKTVAPILPKMIPGMSNVIKVTNEARQAVRDLDASKIPPPLPPPIPPAAARAPGVTPPAAATPPPLPPPMPVVPAPAQAPAPVTAPPAPIPQPASLPAEPQITVIPFAKPTLPASVYEGAARTVKVNKLSQVLHEHGITSKEAAGMNLDQWKLAAKAAEVKIPSAASQAEAVRALAELEAAGRISSKTIERLRTAGALKTAQDLAKSLMEK
jgi:hypothetical protein